MKLLLTEARQVRIQNEGKRVFLEGTFLVGNQVNSNNRYYKSEILEKAVDGIQGRIRQGSCFGMLGHPQTPSGDLERTSHIVESLRKQGSNWFGRARVLDEGCGKIVKSIINANGTLGISARGTGSVKANGRGVNIVEADYKLITCDIVENPSAPGAWLNAIQESILNEEYTVHEQQVARQLLNETAAADSYTRSGRSTTFNLDTVLNKMGPGLADLQRRTGYDFDGKAGNQFRGHAGFPSVPDNSTYLDRLEADRVAAINQLLKLQSEIEYAVDNPGLDQASIKRYIDQVQDPIKRAVMKNRLADEQHDAVMRRRGYELLQRLVKRGDI